MRTYALAAVAAALLLVLPAQAAATDPTCRSEGGLSVFVDDVFFDGFGTEYAKTCTELTLRDGAGKFVALFNRGRFNTVTATAPLAALEDFDVVLALKPDHGKAYYFRALAYYILLRNDAALADAERAEALLPESPLPRFLRGVVLLQARRYKDAAAVLDRPDAPAPIGSGLDEAFAARLAEARLYASVFGNDVPPPPDFLAGREAADVGEQCMKTISTAGSPAEARAAAYLDCGHVALLEAAMLDDVLNYRLATADEGEGLGESNRGYGKGAFWGKVGAHDYFAQALALKPGEADAMFGLVLSAPNEEDAKAALAALIAKHSDYAEAYFERAMQKMSAGDIPGAQADMRTYAALRQKK